MKARTLALLGAVAVAAGLVGRAARDPDVTAPKDPRSILSRLWIDHMPKGPSDDRELWIFFAGGIGIHEKGSWWRSTLDIFDFERQGNKVMLRFLHDKKKAETRFKVESCDDKPPFDVCLTLDDPPRGPKKLYGFGDDDDMDRAMPWGKDEIAAARAKTKNIRAGEE